MDAGERLTRAIGLHRTGELEAAESVYTEVLAEEPRNPDALHFLGVLRFQMGLSTEAAGLIEAAVDAHPGYPDAWANLGNVYRQLGRIDDAQQAYTRSLALNPDQPGTLNNLAILLRARGRFAEAVALHQRAIALVPESADLYLNLANTIREAGDPELAIAAYRKTIELNPAHAGANHRIGLLLHAIGREDEAVEVIRDWAAVAPDDPIATHLLASMTDEGVPERASDDFVRELFDDFAQSFDHVLLNQLRYRAPACVGAALAAVRSAEGSLDVLDAGCGTGLCGPYLRGFARSLTGVDLSTGMLATARQQGGYDRLYEAEIVEFLRAHPESFDVISSADTLVYFGGLEEVAGVARSALRRDGLLIATFERLESRGGAGAARSGDGWWIGPHGRYLHGEAYLRRVFTDAGFEILQLDREVMRREHGSDVEGFVMTARVVGGARGGVNTN